MGGFCGLELSRREKVCMWRMRRASWPPCARHVGHSLNPSSLNPDNALMTQGLFLFYRSRFIEVRSLKGLSDVLKSTKLSGCDYKRIYVLTYIKVLRPKDRLCPLAGTYVSMYIMYACMSVQAHLYIHAVYGLLIILGCVHSLRHVHSWMFICWSCINVCTKSHNY